jgi:WD40 repeat protein
VAISPDGNWAAVGAYTGEVSIFDLKTGRIVQTYAGYGTPESNYMNVETLQFSPDGKLVLFSSIKGNVALLNKDTGTIMKVFRHTQEVYAAAMSPDGKYVATGGSDRIVRVWDAQTGELFYTLTGHTDAIFGIVFSPDGKYVTTASADKTVRIWFTNFEEKRDFACSLISRQLSADEIKTFFVTDNSPVCK